MAGPRAGFGKLWRAEWCLGRQVDRSQQKVRLIENRSVVYSRPDDRGAELGRVLTIRRGCLVLRTRGAVLCFTVLCCVVLMRYVGMLRRTH